MDTDIVSCNDDWALQRIVIFTSLCKCLDKFGYGKALPAYRVNAICVSLGPDTTRPMPLLHSLIGCACHLLLHGQGKEILLGKLESRMVRLQMRSFALLITNITTGTRRTPTSSCLSVFNMVLYDKASNETSVNEARTLQNIPPTQVNVIIRYF